MAVADVSRSDVSAFRWRALAWATAQQAHDGGFVAFLNNNGIAYPNDPFPNRLFVGAKRVISFPSITEEINTEPQRNARRTQSITESPDAFQTLRDAQSKNPSYLVGYFGYDLKNQLETLESRNPDRLGFPDAYFVEPEWVIDFHETEITVQGENADQIVHSIRDFVIPSIVNKPVLAVQCRVSPDEYAATVRRIQQHILAGDVYELNYCIEFFAENAPLDPLTTYRAMNERSPMPFSAFLKVGDRYVMSASPERFLQKQGQELLSQPIKGTIRRGQNPAEDARLRTQLLNSEKERAENLMIVDLVRNDLAR